MTKTKTKLLSTRAAADRCGVSPRTIARWLRTGELKGVKLRGRIWRIEEAELDKFIAGQQPEP